MKVLYSALEAGAGAQIWLQVPLLPSRYLYIQYCVRYTYSLQVATAASLFILISSPPLCTCVAHSGGRPDEVRSLPLRYTFHLSYSTRAPSVSWFCFNSFHHFQALIQGQVVPVPSQGSPSMTLLIVQCTP